MGKISILLLILVCLSGCATEYNIATRKEELILYGTEREVNLGRSLSRQFEEKYKLLEDRELQIKIEQIGQRIAASSDRKDIIYYFKAVEDEEVPNACALPGGWVYINKELIDATESDDEIAAILAHEVAHIAAKHSIKKLQGMLGYGLVSILIASTDAREIKRGADLAFAYILAGYSQEDEFLADKLGARYARRAEYNPEAIISVLRKLKEIDSKRPLSRFSYLRTHPPISERISKVKEEIFGRMDYLDYFNR